MYISFMKCLVHSIAKVKTKQSTVNPLEKNNQKSKKKNITQRCSHYCNIQMRKIKKCNINKNKQNIGNSLIYICVFMEMLMLVVIYGKFS